MAATTTAGARWTELDGMRQGLILRCEKYASLTLPQICLPNHYDQDNDELQYDYQSIGAQAVNHVTNKLMLAMFAPSRPFALLDPGKKTLDEMAKIGVDPEQLRMVLANGERSMVKEVDKRKLRPKLYEAFKHLVVTGNVLLCLKDEGMRVMGLKRYCVKRNVEGKVIEIVIREEVCFDELDEEAQELLTKQHREDEKVELFLWIKKEGKYYTMTQWVDATRLPKQFDGKWKEDACPYKALTWDLSDDSNYGTGLVENYIGSFAAISTLSETQLNAAILASEFRWLVNPAGMTKPEDFNKSENGAAIPGMEGDVVLLQNGKVGELEVIRATNQDYINIVGKGFLLGSAVVRDAERVTAAEIRMQATELETSFGGSYSRLAADMQEPIAKWLLVGIDLDLDGTDIEVVIVTGLDALSRSGDLDNLRGFLQDLGAVAQLPEQVIMRLVSDNLIMRFAQGWGVDPQGLVKPEAQVQEEIAAAQQAQVQQEVQTADGVAQAEAAAQQGA